MTNSRKTSLIIPAAGSALRLRGLPKFLLPTHANNTSLIERHLDSIGDFFDEILIGVNPDFTKLLRSVLGENDKKRILELSTSTMMETVSKLSKQSSSDFFVLVMPDTYFSDYNEITRFLKAENSDKSALLCWEIRSFQIGKLGQVSIDHEGNVVDIQDKNVECEYKNFWGMASFSREDLEIADESDSHIGFMYERLLKQNIQVKGVNILGSYYDCGTPQEYIRMLIDTQTTRQT